MTCDWRPCLGPLGPAVACCFVCHEGLVVRDVCPRPWCSRLGAARIEHSRVADDRAPSTVFFLIWPSVLLRPAGLAPRLPCLGPLGPAVASRVVRIEGLVALDVIPGPWSSRLGDDLIVHSRVAPKKTNKIWWVIMLYSN